MNCYLEIFKGHQIFCEYVELDYNWYIILLDVSYIGFYIIFRQTSGTEPHMRDAYYIAHSCKKIECTKIQW